MNEPSLREYERKILARIPYYPRQRQVMTAYECAKFLGCSPDYVTKKLMQMPGFKACKVGRRYMISKKDLRWWLYEHPDGIGWRQRREILETLPELNWD